MASVISFGSLTTSFMQEQYTAFSKGMGSVSVEATLTKVLQMGVGQAVWVGGRCLRSKCWGVAICWDSLVIHRWFLYMVEGKAGLLSLFCKTQKAQIFWHDLLISPPNAILLGVRIST